MSGIVLFWLKVTFSVGSMTVRFHSVKSLFSIIVNKKNGILFTLKSQSHFPNTNLFLIIARKIIQP